MATIPSSASNRPGRSRRADAIIYPDSDGKPVGETGIHVYILFEMLDVLRRHFEGNDQVAILANMFLYYEEGNPRKNVSPDVFVTLGVPANPFRRTFKVWEEGKSPDFVLELTSKGTRNEDRRTKFQIYQDVLQVREYFLFDPEEDYLKPSLQGYNLVAGTYVPIVPVAGRLPSEVLGLHFERDGLNLRAYDPIAGHWVPNSREVTSTLEETEAALRREEAALRREEAARRQEGAARHREEAARKTAELENERLRREIDELKRRLSGSS